MTRRGTFCSTSPAHSIRNTKGAALPSIAGTSGPSSSTTALSTSSPAKAAIRCSMVATDTPLAAMVVQSEDSVMLRQTASISAPFLSLRRKRMPVSGAAGCSVNSMRAPECSPTPRQWIGAFKVFCAGAKEEEIVMPPETPFSRDDLTKRRCAAQITDYVGLLREFRCGMSSLAQIARRSRAAGPEAVPAADANRPSWPDGAGRPGSQADPHRGRDWAPAMSGRAAPDAAPVVRSPVPRSAPVPPAARPPPVPHGWCR